MGIYDREYYRDETGGSGWLSGTAPVCRTLILINIAAYIAQLLYPSLTDLFDARSGVIFEQLQIHRLLTATFLHDPTNLFHLLFNMLFLWFVGREMESMYGGPEFARMYITAAVVSSLVWSLISYFGPDHARHSMLGASGAIMAVVVLYTLYYPRREVLLFYVLPVPMWLLLVVYLGRDAFSLIQQFQGISSGGATALAAHLGGAAYGYAYKRYDLRWSRLHWPVVGRPKLRIVRPEAIHRDREIPLSQGPGRTVSASPATRSAPTGVIAEEQLDARLDEILAKIAQEGRGGLTDDENRILQEASRRARDRRGVR